MIISSAKYIANETILAVIDGVDMFVPDDMANGHRQKLFEWEAKGNVLEPYALASPTSDLVDLERDRRINGGFAFQGVCYQSRPQDRENIAGAALAALAAISAGAVIGDYRWHGADSDFQWIAEDNNLHLMDAQTMFAFGQTAMAHKQSIIFAARALKDMAEIPADYADDEYWHS